MEPSWRRKEIALCSLKGDIRQFSKDQRSAIDSLNYRWTYLYSTVGSNPIPGLNICAAGRQCLHMVVVRMLGIRKNIVTSNGNGSGLEADDMIPR